MQTHNGHLKALVDALTVELMSTQKQICELKSKFEKNKDNAKLKEEVDILKQQMENLIGESQNRKSSQEKVDNTQNVEQSIIYNTCKYNLYISLD